MSDRPGFMVYFDIRPAVLRLDLAQRGALFTALLDYAETGTLPDKLDDLTGMAFDLIRPKLDKDAERYADKKLRSRYAAYCKVQDDRSEGRLSFEEWAASEASASER